MLIEIYVAIVMWVWLLQTVAAFEAEHISQCIGRSIWAASALASLLLLAQVSA